ncbi:spermatogenesis-associated serine-rich protein 1 isoform X1 [Erpetoichthys calabaricus]|uniref:spermatogenesis-associated serine-rich protein 1 isoform X1 n=1 Tax=Erpetoichthys calabaricus TaxID=27687 RepID=UPI002234DDAD|nr:spermatogenesis-associated serine-rich protein 1 isoform X1 [Erpetoichthys calabaricus]
MTSVEKDLSAQFQTADEQHLSSSSISSRNMLQQHKPCGRRYYPHGYGSEKVYRPHVQHIEPQYTHSDLDWTSRLRWLPEPVYGDAPFPDIKLIKFPSETRLLRPFPQSNAKSEAEWTSYPNFGLPFTYHSGKRCKIDGAGPKNATSTSEQMLSKLFGRKKKALEYDSASSLCGKPYHSPEYSGSFHKLGSTLPLTKFGAPPDADTFIPLCPLPAIPCKPYSEKEKIRQQNEEVNDVKLLDKWRAATPILNSILFSEGGRK